MERQAKAAVGRAVEWHVAEEKFADFLAEHAKLSPNVHVIYEPPSSP